jgi:hypothetical protein
MSRKAQPIRPASQRPGHYGTSLNGDAVTIKTGGVIHADTFGTDIAIRSSTPPPVSAYDEWLGRRNYSIVASAHKATPTGAKLRRIVIMRRAGCTWAECGAAVGVSYQTARTWVQFLPQHMGA